MIPPAFSVASELKSLDFNVFTIFAFRQNLEEFWKVTMINAQRQRVEQEMTALVDNLDKSHLRKMQVSAKESNSHWIHMTFTAN